MQDCHQRPLYLGMRDYVWHFGMKAHIDVDAESGLVHTVRGASGNVNDVVEANAQHHGEEKVVFADFGYRGAYERQERSRK